MQFRHGRGRRGQRKKRWWPGSFYRSSPCPFEETNEVIHALDVPPPPFTLKTPTFRLLWWPLRAWHLCLSKIGRVIWGSTNFFLCRGLRRRSLTSLSFAVKTSGHSFSGAPFPFRMYQVCRLVGAGQKKEKFFRQDDSFVVKFYSIPLFWRRWF